MAKSTKQSRSKCEICGKQFAERTPADIKKHGFRDSNICDDCWEIENNKKPSRSENDLRQAGFFTRHLLQTFDNYEVTTDAQKEILNECKRYAAAPKGRVLILIGNAGTGKDHIASAIARTFQGTIYAANEIDLLMKYNDITFQKNEKAAIDFFGSVGLLVIRDVGVKEHRENAKATITNVMDRRYNTMKPTIITTNAQPAELKNVFDMRIIDRLREVSFRHNKRPYLLFDWQTYRGQK